MSKDRIVRYRAFLRVTMIWAFADTCYRLNCVLPKSTLQGPKASVTVNTRRSSHWPLEIDAPWLRGWCPSRRRRTSGAWPSENTARTCSLRPRRHTAWGARENQIKLLQQWEVSFYPNFGIKLRNSSHVIKHAFSKQCHQEMSALTYTRPKTKSVSLSSSLSIRVSHSQRFMLKLYTACFTVFLMALFKFFCTECILTVVNTLTS